MSTELTDPAADLEHDADIYAAVKDLALTVIARSKDILENGAPSLQLQMVRVLLPTLTRSLKANDGHENGELRQAVESMYASIREAIGA
jgi:hypothetical protein